MTSYSNYKVIVVDNGSSDDSATYLKKVLPSAEMVSLKKNYGYTEGTNIGWKYALSKLKADYVCAMDNDLITIQPEWLDLIIDELERSPQRGIGSGKHLFPDGRLQHPYEEADWKYSNVLDTNRYDFVKEVKSFAGPGIVIKREVIEKIGYYDENFFYGPNDVDYCYRARNAGFKVVYIGTSRSIHIGSSSGLTGSAKDFIYLNQSEGMMIFSFRYGDLWERLHMSVRQLGRAFVTRVDPVSPMEKENLFFHKTFPLRVYYYGKALSKALKNHKLIKSSDTESKIAQ
jgi:GT2 family glycosyltransferase